MSLKLLYITTNIESFGGVSRILSVKLNYLIEKFGYEIHVFNSNHGNDDFFYTFNNDITFYHFRKRKFRIFTFFDFKNSVVNVVKDINPDVIINCDNGLKGALLAFFIGRKTPIIYERHSGRDTKGEKFIENFKIRLSNVFIDLGIKKYKAFVVPNHNSFDLWKGKNVQIIPNPLWFKMTSKISSLDYRVVVAVGRCVADKQYDVLIRIWKEVVTEFPEWLLKIYGDENCPNILITLVQNLGISKNIEFCKPVKDIEKIYLNASILLNTSSSEEFGLAIMEAMAYGLPVIAFDNTMGPKYLIEDNITGFLIGEGDYTAYAEKIKLLINDKSLRQSVGMNARKSLDRFDLDQTMKLWHDLFQSTL